MKVISSSQNPRFRLWTQLLESKGVKKEGLCLVSGRKTVPELIRQFPNSCQDLIVTKEEQLLEVCPDQFPMSLHTYQIPNELFKKLDEFGTQYPLLIFKYNKVEESWSEQEAPHGLEVLASLGDPQNLGALLRSCEAFGVSRVVLLRESVFPFHPKVIRASSGSVFRVPLFRGPSAQDLKGPLIVLDQEGENLQNFKWPKNARLLMGEEGPGVAESLKSQTRVSIPMKGQVESLNAVAATSIALYSYRSEH